jgi:hypothetical protein
MIGKKNIVFGFLYLVLTAALGPYMVTIHFGTYLESLSEQQQVMSELAQVRAAGYEKDLRPLSAQELARLNSEAILAMNRAENARSPIAATRAPHAHGNLEALLNVAAGLVLSFLAVNIWLKQAISWIFMLGAVLHSGMLYLRAFDVPWAGMVLESGIGPILVLSGLSLIGIVCAFGLRSETVRDY